MANTRTVGSSGKDHTTIASAISWMQSNHDFSTDGIGTVDVQEAAEFNESPNMTGVSGTPSSTAYLHLTTTTNAHSGAAGTGHARIRGTSGNVLDVQQNWCRVSNLEIEQDSTTTSAEAIRVHSVVQNVLIERCVIWTDRAVSSQDGIYMGNWAANYSIDNSIIYGFHRAGIHAQNYNGTNAQEARVDHCTVFGCGGGGGTWAGGISAIASASGSSTNVKVYTTASLDNTGADFQSQTSSGTLTWTGTHNACTDTSLTTIGLTTGAQESLTVSDTTQSSGDYFVVNETASGSEDYTLLDDAAGNKAINNATDRQGSEPDSRQDFSTDIEGTARATTGTRLRDNGPRPSKRHQDGH